MSSTVSRTTRAPARSHAPDRCPGVLRPHPAQDGLLVRVRLVGGRLGVPALRALRLGAGHGNGIVELTSRGSVQLRGLSSEALPTLTAALTDAGVLRSAAHERARNILCDPLAGRRPTSLAHVDDVVAELDDALCADPALSALPGRFLFAVDDGSGALDDVDADVMLRARGDGRWTRTVPEALAVAHRFLAAAPSAGTWRISDLPPQVQTGVLGDAAAVQPPLGSGPVPVLGTVAQRDGRLAIGALAPLGRLTKPALAVLEALAAEHPVRVSHRRSVAVLDVDPAAAPGIAARLEAAGLVAASGTGWEGLTACAGLGACAKARGDVRAAAAARVPLRAAGSPREHWAGCERRCGDGPSVARTVVADGRGGWAVAA